MTLLGRRCQREDRTLAHCGIRCTGLSGSDVAALFLEAPVLDIEGGGRPTKLFFADVITYHTFGIYRT